MAGTNQFFPFASGPGANALTAAAWGALPVRQSGFASGIAPSVQFNTAWRQPTNMASAIGQFIANRNFDALDNGDIETLRANFEAALLAYAGSAVPDAQRVHIGQDTGPANTITVDIAPSITAYAFLSFYLVRVAATNTGPTTANLDGVGAQPLRRRDGSDLQAGDILAGTVIAFAFDGTIFRLLDLALGEVPRISDQSEIWIRPDGNDANGGRFNNTQNAVATFARAFAIARGIYFPGGGLAIKLGAAGTYQFPPPSAVPVFSGPIRILGNAAAQSNFVLSNSDIGTGAGNCVESSGLQDLTLEGVTVSNASSGSLTAASSAGGKLTLLNVTVQSAAGNGAALIYTNGGTITIGAGCVANSSAGAVLGARAGTVTIGSNNTLTIAGNRTFSTATVVASDNATITFRPGSSFAASGTITGVRESLDANAVLRLPPLSNANFVPGSTTVAPTNGAQRVVGS